MIDVLTVVNAHVMGPTVVLTVVVVVIDVVVAAAVIERTVVVTRRGAHCRSSRRVVVDVGCGAQRRSVARGTSWS